MKKRNTIALILAAAMLFTSCSKAAEETTEETTRETTAATTTTAEETTAQTTAAPTATPTPRPTTTPTPIPSPTPVPTVEMPDPFPDLAAPEGTYFTSNGESYEEYFVTDYTFADDCLSGSFTISSFVSYDMDYIRSLSIGDTLDNGNEITDMEFIPENGRVVIDREQGWLFIFELQENGSFYFFDEIGFPSTTQIGTQEFAISPDVIVVDGTRPFGPYGIKFGDYTTYFDGVQGFLDQLNDESTWYAPDLYIRVQNGQIVFIAVNPNLHEAWHD